jgi:methylated-DNA-[protein]-cysteine S-methyltransferase
MTQPPRARRDATSRPGAAGRLQGMTTRVHTTTDSPLGPLTLVREGEALVGLYLPGHAGGPGPYLLGEPAQDGFDDAVAQLQEYFAGRRTRFDLVLRPAGTALQQRVWQLLTQVPYGRTTTYGDLARQLGGPGLARAVGSANARNPISIVVPCHRVVGADGRLVGYAGGLERKRRLLDLERGVAPLP